MMHVVREILGGRWSAAQLTMLLVLLLGLGTALNSGLVLGWRLVDGTSLAVAGDGRADPGAGSATALD